jgi:hypothetical protein
MPSRYEAGAVREIDTDLHHIQIWHPVILIPVDSESIHAVRQLGDLTEVPDIVMNCCCAGHPPFRDHQGYIIVLGQVHIGTDAALVYDLAA